MLSIFISVSRYIFILLGFYFLYSSIMLNKAMFEESHEKTVFYFNAQKLTVFLSHCLGFVILFVTQSNFLDLLILYVEEVLFFMLIWFVIDKIYYKTNLLIWNIVLFITQLGFVILTRLDFGVGKRQFYMALIGFFAALIIPIIIDKLNFVTKLYPLYLILSVGFLFLVNDTINGAKNWSTIGTFSFQPSEFVKILFILFIASLFRTGINKFRLLLSALLCGTLVIILVYQTDLGGALIFTFLYITLIYILTARPIIFFGGLGIGSLGAFIGYKLFAHVKVRVEAWANPWADIDKNGYQIAQSLFAIGAGGWLGSGLTKGMPSYIPVVLTDFIFSAISEELGNVFSVFLIGILIMLFLSSIKMTSYIEDRFMFIISIGVSIIIAFQQFLIIGGVTKLIPSTGVTLPFISYGGTSLIASCIMIGILQGAFYNLRKVHQEDEK